MKIKHYILLAIIAVVLVGGSIALYMYFKPHKDFGASTPDFVVGAKDLMNEFETDEASANQKFATGDKTTMVSGTVDNVSTNADNTFTVVLTQPGMSGSIRCSLVAAEAQKAENLKKGDAVQIKGQCTGLEELLDKQVIMIRCVIV